MHKIVSQNVNFYYGEFQALHDISLSMKENTVTALIGPSGCGKSTYLRLLNRMNDLIDNTQMTGSITIDGNDIYEMLQDIQKDENGFINSIKLLCVQLGSKSSFTDFTFIAEVSKIRSGFS